MNKTAEKLYLYLAWYIKAYGYTPAQTDIAMHCDIVPQRVIYWLREVAKAGYIKLYQYENGDIKVKLLIDPTRPWVANLQYNTSGQPVALISEVPIKLYIWHPGAVVPAMIMSQKDLLKANLIKAGIIENDET